MFGLIVDIFFVSVCGWFLEEIQVFLCDWIDSDFEVDFCRFFVAMLVVNNGSGMCFIGFVGLDAPRLRSRRLPAGRREVCPIDASFEQFH